MPPSSCVLRGPTGRPRTPRVTDLVVPRTPRLTDLVAPRTPRVTDLVAPRTPRVTDLVAPRTPRATDLVVPRPGAHPTSRAHRHPTAGGPRVIRHLAD